MQMKKTRTIILIIFSCSEFQFETENFPMIIEFSEIEKVCKCNWVRKY